MAEHPNEDEGGMEPGRRNTGEGDTDGAWAGQGARKDRVDQARLDAETERRADHVRRTLRGLCKLPREAAVQMARNMDPMIGAVKKVRKNGFTLGDLVVRSGIGKSGDETRLGKFRLSSRSKKEAEGNISVNPSHYLNLAEECAKMTDGSLDEAVLALVDGTSFHPAVSGVSVEGFNRAHELLGHMVASIAQRHDLDWYFDETARRDAFRTGNSESLDEGWVLDGAIGMPVFNSPGVSLLHNVVSRTPGEMLGTDGHWYPVDVLVLERVRFGIAKLRGDLKPTGYFFLSPWLGLTERGGSILEFLSFGVPPAVQGEFSAHFMPVLKEGHAKSVALRLPPRRSMSLGPYHQFFPWEGEDLDVGLTERLSLSGVERVLGGSEFLVVQGWGDLAEEAAPGITEAPPDTAAARVEALILFSYASVSMKRARGGDTIRKALEDDAREHVETFKAFLARQREEARERAARVVDEMYERPDPGIRSIFDVVAVSAKDCDPAVADADKH
ncbi:hypothetical protein FHW79_006010 [Azospirillum sp. OGB3]|uniref:hypothetical protein n=1 Tax=Azospirillum sp. OGB3 TaxID=2587012 RepID=UPI001605F3FC|nr:hypothetical protein [Azospirillum sp. OGB3]MBB3268335.1 hypothetical protein [Azospirillum sp. OGB3]